MGYTPMMQHYLDTKEKYKDCILFYRLGDFYEMFFDDALTASKVMEVTLTGKNCGMKERAPMCGVPHHSVDAYIAKLVDKGYKVAICEQMEDPATAKGIVKREVVRVVTPGTVTSQTMLSEKENNYLACIYVNDKGSGLAYCDLSTGEIGCGEFKGDRFEDKLTNELVKLKAKEILYNDYVCLDDLENNIKASCDGFFDNINPHYFDKNPCIKAVERQFGVSGLNGLGLGDKDEAVTALGALLQYLYETQKQSLVHLINLTVIDNHSYMSLDKATLRNLELTETLYDKKVQGSLLGVLDKTGTAMGSRKMKQWLREPLNDSAQIQRRIDAVELLCENYLLRNDIRDSLKEIYDLERLSGRVACGNANARDLLSLKRSIAAIPTIKNDIFDSGVELIEELYSEIDEFKELHELIDSAIAEEPPIAIKDGGLIKPGYSEELDSLKNSIKDGQNWIASLENEERERTGIKNLKVGFNKVFGYYLEVTKSNYEFVPENYIRKQTLVNCERFITPELKEVESVVLNAETKINQMEYELFTQIREIIQKYIPAIQKTSSALASLDVLASFAEASSKYGYVKPVINDGDEICIEKGRHPVIEQSIKDGIFVSNDLYTDRKEHSMLLITGPNMAGKSTYMRQNALIVLMAQAGCYVPCEKAAIGVVDRIYTRIGASDNLAQGQSTFYVEMSELAYILNTATEKSLIILDEIGRGTSTYDGLSIAWAVIEYLCNTKRKIRTLFATHYHELTAMEGAIKGVKNLNVDVREENGTVVFLHKIIEGSASRSYGIHVARIAGVPNNLLDAAEMKLEELEKNSNNINLSEMNESLSVAENSGNSRDMDSKKSDSQLSFFGFAPNPIVEKIRELDLLNITPSQAFMILEELKKAVQ